VLYDEKLKARGEKWWSSLYPGPLEKRCKGACHPYLSPLECPMATKTHAIEYHILPALVMTASHHYHFHKPSRITVQPFNLCGYWKHTVVFSALKKHWKKTQRQLMTDAVVLALCSSIAEPSWGSSSSSKAALSKACTLASDFMGKAEVKAVLNCGTVTAPENKTTPTLTCKINYLK